MLLDSFIIVSLIFMLGIHEYISFREQKELWNNGISPVGRKWKLKDTSLPDIRIYEDDFGNQCVINSNFNIER